MDVSLRSQAEGHHPRSRCSCHSIEALRTATKSPWSKCISFESIPLALTWIRIRTPSSASSAEMRAAGKGIIGMKILGQGQLRNRQDEALRYALSLNLLDAFTIGAESKAEQEDLIRRIAAT